jgi:hypothetical protein
MDTYQAEELHLFRSGQTYGGDETKVDNLGKGYERLRDSKLAAWITETTRAHGLEPQLAASQGSRDPAPSTADDDVTEYIEGLQNADAEHDEDHVVLTPGSIRMENGNIIIDIQAEDDENEGVAGDSELPEQEEMENEENGELIIGSEEVEDWEQVEQDAQ